MSKGVSRYTSGEHEHWKHTVDVLGLEARARDGTCRKFSNFEIKRVGESFFPAKGNILQVELDVRATCGTLCTLLFYPQGAKMSARLFFLCTMGHYFLIFISLTRCFLGGGEGGVRKGRREEVE